MLYSTNFSDNNSDTPFDMKSERKIYLRRLPAVNELVGRLKSRNPSSDHQELVEATRSILGKIRQSIFESQESELDRIDLSCEYMLYLIEDELEREDRISLRRLINATGVILHTNLGRAPLSKEALEELDKTAGRYTNLEFDLNQGQRGSRYASLERLLVKLTGAEDVLVVNNNAAAVLLALDTIAKGREVIVSRGELIEIGGSFRIPEVMKKSSAELVEVGTTNKTYLRDYEEAISENTSLLLKVHTSNFHIIGFTASVSPNELVELGKRRSIPIMYDLGSGALSDLRGYGLSEEPLLTDSVRAGADIITCSGDKLLGGPQCGLIAGKRKYIERMKRNHLLRALRVGKLTIAALEATLRLYLEKRIEAIPVWNMISISLPDITNKLSRFIDRLKEKVGDRADIEMLDGCSRIGGGSCPTADIPTKLVGIVPKHSSVNELEMKLRFNDPPILARISADKLLLDLRTVFEDEVEEIISALGVFL